MNCPACGAAMRTLDFEAALIGRVTVDFCFPCQVVWFDEHESTELAPGGVLEVFKALDANRSDTRNSLPPLLHCPRCHIPLTSTQDVQRTTHFRYYRCLSCHGRLTPFVDFLREKNFVRPISGTELAALKARVRTVQCSNCGAPVDLERDSACPYCGSPISIVDPDAISKTVRELSDAETRRATVDIGKLADALLLPPPSTTTPEASRNLIVGDLVAAGIGLVAALLR